MQYNPVTEEVLTALREALGEQYVKTDPQVLSAYKEDESLTPSF